MGNVRVLLILLGVCFSVGGVWRIIRYFVHENPARYTKLEGRIYDVNAGTIEVYRGSRRGALYSKLVFYPVIEYEFQGKLMRQQAKWYSENTLAYHKGDIVHITVSNRYPREISVTEETSPVKICLIAICAGAALIAAAILLRHVGGINGTVRYRR